MCIYRFITNKHSVCVHIYIYVYKELKVMFFYKQMCTDSLIISRVQKSSYESNSRGKPSNYFLQNIVFYKKMVYVKNTVK